MPIYECRNSDFLLTDLANLDDRSVLIPEPEPDLFINKKNQSERELQNHRNTHGPSIRISSTRSLKEPSRRGFTSSGKIDFDRSNNFNINMEFLKPESLMMRNSYRDNILDSGKYDLDFNDSHSVVGKEISQTEMCHEDDNSVATMTSTLSSISALSMTSAFHNAQDKSRRLFSKFRHAVDNVKDSLALELEAEKEKEIQSRCDRN